MKTGAWLQSVSRYGISEANFSVKTARFVWLCDNVKPNGVVA